MGSKKKDYSMVSKAFWVCLICNCLINAIPLLALALVSEFMLEVKVRHLL